MRCKLPHVIRANRKRQPAADTHKDVPLSADKGTADSAHSPLGADPTPSLQPSASALSVTAPDAQLGDEFISLTFNESESEDEEDSDENSESEDDSNESEEGDDHDHLRGDVDDIIT